MKRNGGTLSSEPLKARRASLSKSDASTDATVPIKRSSTAVENSKPLIPSTARASSPAAQKIRAAEWAAAQFGEKPKISKSPVRAKSPARAKSPGRAKSLARAESPPPLSPPVENPVTIKKTRKSSSKFDAEVLERTLEGISQSSPTINKPRSLRPRPSVESAVASSIAVVSSVESRVIEEPAMVARARHSTKGTLVKLILGVHVVAGISLYVYHTITLTPTIFNCPIEAYISIGVIACLHIYSFM